MATKKKVNPMAKASVLLVLVGVPVLFILATYGTSTVLNIAPYAIPIILAIASAVYNGMTCGYLYRYYESSQPWYSWLPCYGELALMDSKFVFPGTIAYVVAFIGLLVSIIPYNVISGLGDLAFSLPIYGTILFFVAMFAVEVIKGIGIRGCVKVISEEWQEKMHVTLGSIKLFGWLGFIPFVRVMAIYGLNKPLSTLVVFNDATVSDSDEVELEETDE